MGPAGWWGTAHIQAQGLQWVDGGTVAGRAVCDRHRGTLGPEHGPVKLQVWSPHPHLPLTPTFPCSCHQGPQAAEIQLHGADSKPLSNQRRGCGGFKSLGWGVCEPETQRLGAGHQCGLCFLVPRNLLHRKGPPPSPTTQRSGLEAPFRVWGKKNKSWGGEHAPASQTRS